MPYSRPVRFLHALVALAIVAQLATTWVMDHPHPNHAMRPEGAVYFQWHEWLGLAALAILAAGWIYRTVNWRRETQGRLFPWINAAGRKALKIELLDFLKLRWTRVPEHGALTGTVHGLGLLITTLMAATGTVIYILLGPENTVNPSTHQVMDFHSFLGNFMWAFLYGHVAMALWHQYKGHGNLGHMFRP